MEAGRLRWPGTARAQPCGISKKGKKLSLHSSLVAREVSTYILEATKNSKPQLAEQQSFISKLTAT